jgi:hypothetical protein
MTSLALVQSLDIVSKAVPYEFRIMGFHFLTSFSVLFLYYFSPPQGVLQMILPLLHLGTSIN